MPLALGFAFLYGATFDRHRPEVYTWPNPWMTANWGINDQKPRSFDGVDYLVIDRAMVTEDKYKDLLRRIEESPATPMCSTSPTSWC